MCAFWALGCILSMDAQHYVHWHACWVLAVSWACIHSEPWHACIYSLLSALNSGYNMIRCILLSWLPCKLGLWTNPFLSLAFFWVFYYSNRKWKQGTIPAGTGTIRLSRDTILCKLPADQPLSILSHGSAGQLQCLHCALAQSNPFSDVEMASKSHSDVVSGLICLRAIKFPLLAEKQKI